MLLYAILLPHLFQLLFFSVYLLSIMSSVTRPLSVLHIISSSLYCFSGFTSQPLSLCFLCSLILCAFFLIHSFPSSLCPSSQHLAEVLSILLRMLVRLCEFTVAPAFTQLCAYFSVHSCIHKCVKLWLSKD